MQDKGIARSLRVGTATVERVHRRCVEEGLELAAHYQGLGTDVPGPPSAAAGPDSWTGGLKDQHNRRQRKLVGGNEAHLAPRGNGHHDRAASTPMRTRLPTIDKEIGR